jgi:hypothetical protein
MNDKKFLAILSGVDSRTRRILSKMIAELANVGIDYADLPKDSIFRFNDYPQYSKSVQRIVERYAKLLTQCVEQAQTASMQSAFKSAAQSITQLNLPENVFAVAFNADIVGSFKEYRDNMRHGLNLSQRVWNYTSQCKAEFEIAMSQCIENGIAKGTGAEALGREIRSMLNRPDAVYRRYHLRRMNADGTTKDVIEWRRKTVDAQGRVHFKSTDIEHLGRGVYRSSRQNALRLATNEINMSYRYAESSRMNADKFCRGYEIRLSNNHPDEDICDELQGEYPKSFLFTGWHPRCRCSVLPIMVPAAEMLAYLELNEQQRAAWQPSQGYIKDVPSAFRDYVRDNADKFTASLESGKGAYFIRDNASLINSIINPISSNSNI